MEYGGCGVGVRWSAAAEMSTSTSSTSVSETWIARECFHVLSHNTTTRPVKRMNGVVRCVVRSHCHLGPEQEISWHLYYI